ncbi:glycoside-pentoside-hexuronide (GPH):cation symporter [Georgenia sp. EYE_87]|uniref:glycoside-pentoside-hexuronide (GPH):cation symporter n=1 Tax=Georgenia sp. EYE_87 TaxID=2853448 RepID=UPI00200582F9|nr:glycoside-pentoside-hexuronide (GPH):cation symporter [Georgenia sp. EYE_87]MCK6209488.1 glycoside-pentoside-hexuronide (GPH):cation symporter [Georgenia sp. EYE_87]
MSSTATAQQQSIHDAAAPHLSFRTIAGYGAGDAGCNIAFQMTGLFLLIFYTDVVGISPVHAGNIFLFVKIWDAFADIFAGRMVDRTMTRWGKFRPFLLWYSVPLLAMNLLCFWIPVDDYGMKLVWATVSYAVLGLLYSLVNIPFGSLAGAMSQNPVDRSRLASARMVGSGATILLLSLVLAPQIKAADDLATTFLVTSALFLVIGTVMFMTTFLTSKETVYREVEKVSLRETIRTVRQNKPLLRLCASSFFYLTGQNVVSAMGIYIANDALAQYAGAGNWLASVVTIITTGAVLYVGPLGPGVTRRLGKKTGFMGACGIAITGGLIFGLSGSLLLSLVGLFLIGFGMALLNTMTWALEADTVEYGELQTGIRTEGATYAAFSFTRKVGQAVGAAIASYSLAFVGYNGELEVQPQSVIDGMTASVAFLPAAFFLVALLIMSRYPLTEARFAEIMTQIQARRAERHAELAGTGTAPADGPAGDDGLPPAGTR